MKSTIQEYRNGSFTNLCQTLILTVILLMAVVFNGNAQVFKVGLKAGPNFSNLNGGIGGIDYKSRTGVHVGAVAELGLTSKFSIQPELLYSSQGAEVEGFGDFNLDYIAIPVMAKIYVLSDKVSVDIGPQFSFLVNDSEMSYFGQIEDQWENESFDFAMAGGVTLNVTKSIFAQARYTVGLTEASKAAEVKNSVFQLSVGYMFF